MDRCPKCTSRRIRRSRSRTVVERIRRQFSEKRLFRCDACGWRGWGIELERPVAADDVRPADRTPPDLDAVDAALHEAASQPDADAKA